MHACNCRGSQGQSLAREVKIRQSNRVNTCCLLYHETFGISAEPAVHDAVLISLPDPGSGQTGQGRPVSASGRHFEAPFWGIHFS